MIRRWLYSRKGEREGFDKLGHTYSVPKSSRLFFGLPAIQREEGRSLAEYEKKKKKGESKREREGGDWGRIGIGKGGGGETASPSMLPPYGIPKLRNKDMSVAKRGTV